MVRWPADELGFETGVGLALDTYDWETRAQCDYDFPTWELFRFTFVSADRLGPKMAYHYLLRSLKQADVPIEGLNLEAIVDQLLLEFSWGYLPT